MMMVHFPLVTTTLTSGFRMEFASYILYVLKLVDLHIKSFEKPHCCLCLKRQIWVETSVTVVYLKRQIWVETSVTVVYLKRQHWVETSICPVHMKHDMPHSISLAVLHIYYRG